MDQREKRLLQCLAALADEQQQALLDYAEYLLERHPPAQPEALSDPVAIPRPQQESVVGAIKRLRATYPMVDSAALLNEASSLMAQHLVHGRAGSEVIDELEALFARRFADMTTDV